MPESIRTFKDRCRCCLRPFYSDENVSIITSFFETQFFAFTQLTLDVDSELLSKNVCESCHSELLRFSVFKKDLIEKQQRLNELVKQHIERVTARQQPKTGLPSQIIEIDADDEEDEEEYYEEDLDDLEEGDFLIVKANDEPKELFTKRVVHKSIDAPPEDFICDYCLKSFLKKQGLTRHVQSHVDNHVPWKCKEDGCDFAVSSRIKLNIHKLQVHGIALPLAKADNPLKKKKIAKANSIISFSCFCGASFETSLSLRAHKNRMHGRKNKCIYGCENVQYVKTGHFLRHIQMKHPEKIEECLKRSDLYTSRNNRKSSEILSCDKCDFKTFRKTAIQTHVTSHLPPSERDSFNCKKCQKVFTRATSLRVHLLTVHDKIRKYKCPKCAKTSFKQLAHLNDHIAVKHKKLKHFACEHCNRSFLQRSLLKDHKLKHHKIDQEMDSIHGITKFKCPRFNCHHAFTQRCNLIRHQKEKEHFLPDQLKNLKFSCVCGSRFFTERGYLFHLQKSNCERKD